MHPHTIFFHLESRNTRQKFERAPEKLITSSQLEKDRSRYFLQTITFHHMRDKIHLVVIIRFADMQWREEKGGKRMAGFSRENVAYHNSEGPWCEMHHHARGSKLTVLTTAACCFCVFLFLRFLKASWGGINYAYLYTHSLHAIGKRQMGMQKGT